MRLDNLRSICKREYDTTPEVWKNAIADYEFDSAKAEVDDQTAIIIKEYCQISATSSTPALPAQDDRIEAMAKQRDQIVNHINNQSKCITVLADKVKTLEAELTTLRAEAANVTASLIKEVEGLKEVEPSSDALPAEFVEYESMFTK